jgi:hypothetical protein
VDESQAQVRTPTFCALCVSRCGATAVTVDGRFTVLEPDRHTPTRQSPPVLSMQEHGARTAQVNDAAHSIRAEDVPLAVELRDGDPVSELSQAGVAATSGAAVGVVG